MLALVRLAATHTPTNRLRRRGAHDQGADLEGAAAAAGDEAGRSSQRVRKRAEKLGCNPSPLARELLSLAPTNEEWKLFPASDSPGRPLLRDRDSSVRDRGSSRLVSAKAGKIGSQSSKVKRTLSRLSAEKRKCAPLDLSSKEGASCGDSESAANSAQTASPSSAMVNNNPRRAKPRGKVACFCVVKVNEHKYVGLFFHPSKKACPFREANFLNFRIWESNDVEPDEAKSGMPGASFIFFSLAQNPSFDLAASAEIG